MINKVVNKIKGMNICESVKNCVNKTWKKIDKSNVVVALLFFILGVLAMGVFNVSLGIERFQDEYKGYKKDKEGRHEIRYKKNHQDERANQYYENNNINDTLLDNGDGMMR
jgi:hypothetical protein